MLTIFPLVNHDGLIVESLSAADIKHLPGVYDHTLETLRAAVSWADTEVPKANDNRVIAANKRLAVFFMCSS